MRHLLSFLVLGALLFFGKRAVETHLSERPQLFVQVQASADEREVERAIDEAVLLELALSSRSALIDPLVRDQLLRAMRLQEHARGQDHDQALLEQALSLGVHRVDPVVRQRLIFQAQQVLRASLQAPVPTRAELQAYRSLHVDRYREPARVSFRQVFLSRNRRGKQLQADATALAQRLTNPQLGPSAIAALSDPTLLPFELERASVGEIDARFGPGVGQRVHSLAEARWSGPIASSYGVHLVYVTARHQGRLPALAEQQRRVLSDFRHDAGERALKAAVRTRREGYRIVLRRGPA